MDIKNINSPAVNSNSDRWFEDKEKNQVSVDSFLQLMVAQLKNQDFNNPVDDTQYLTQLAQFTTMQAMQQLNQYSMTAYATSLVGKEVRVAKVSSQGELQTFEGVVEKVSLIDNEVAVYVNQTMFTLAQIMEVKVSQDE